MYTEEGLKLKYKARLEHLSEQLAYCDIDHCEYEDAILELNERLENDLADFVDPNGKVSKSLRDLISRYSR